MRIASVAIALVGSALLTGCASGSSAAGGTSENVAPSASSAENVPDPTSAEGRVRCAMIADSVRAATPMANLPIARPRGRVMMPTPGPGAARAEVRTVFLVAPSGVPVPGTVVVTGPADASFRQEMENALAGALYHPPKVRGCPSWSRGDIRIRARIERRRMD